jgi:acyl-coenzyme A thioesterase PaaI-like protein
LIVEKEKPDEITDNETDGKVNPGVSKSAFYEENLERLRDIHHSQCMFNRKPSIIPGLRFWFADSGVLQGQFTCSEFQQGYDTMVHGGVIAAIIDSSMAQCLMGHGIVGYTVDLAVKYRKPVMINQLATLTTEITDVNCNVLYSMKCRIVQKHNLLVHAIGKFYKVK